MILQLNHLHGKAAATSTQSVVAALYALMEEGHIDQKQFSRLQVQLDWVQYKQNFREMVTASRPLCFDRGEKSSILDVRIDARQIVPENLKDQILRAIHGANLSAGQQPDAIVLEDF